MDYSAGSFQKVIEAKREEKTIIDSEVRRALAHQAWGPAGPGDVTDVAVGTGQGQSGGRVAGARPFFPLTRVWRFLHAVACADFKCVARRVRTVTHAHCVPRSSTSPGGRQFPAGREPRRRSARGLARRACVCRVSHARPGAFETHPRRQRARKPSLPVAGSAACGHSRALELVSC